MNILEEYYNSYNEDERLEIRHGQVEYLTTMRYIHKYLPEGSRLLVVGAGTGRYSIALSREGYRVHAIELIPHNIEVFRSKLTEEDTVVVEQGNALDLSRFADETFDGVLVLGPMYHLYTEEDELKALAEAKRVLKKDGVLMIAYCMNDPSVIHPCFQEDGQLMLDEIAKGNVNEAFHFRTALEEIFTLYRLEEIDALNRKSGLRRLEIIGTDLFTKYIQDRIDEWREEVFQVYLNYHFAVCMRQELIGVSHHTLDIVKKEKI